jgi:hypothetical protein
MLKQPVHLLFDFTVEGSDIIPDPPANRNDARRDFCKKFDGYGDFCNRKISFGFFPLTKPVVFH